MNGEMIATLQMGIWIILAIMIGLIVLYIVIMSKASKKNNSNNPIDQKGFEDFESINSDDDNGPIQTL